MRQAYLVKVVQQLIGIAVLILVLFNFYACTGEGSNVSKTNSTPTESTKPAKAVLKVPTFNADTAYAFIEKQLSFGPRVPGTPQHKACAEWLEATLKTYTPDVMVQRAKVDNHDGRKLPVYNIIAAFNPDAKERVLLCAHWDTRPNADKDTVRVDEPIAGANDGGSGVGVLLEIARQLATTGINMGIDIILFDTEDGGAYRVDDSFCLGSQYWSKNKHIPNYTAKYGILLDMVGGKGASFPREQYSMLYAKDIVDKVWQTAAELGFNGYFVDIKSPPITDDHYYVNKFAGIPTIDIIHYTAEGNFGDFWHTHDDDIGVISKSSLKAVGQTVLTVIYKEAQTVQ